MVQRAAGQSRSDPRDISFVDELPRTSVGKIRKFLLKDPTCRVHVQPTEDASSMTDQSVLTDDLLDSFDDSVLDVDKACTLPPACYTTDEFLEFERRALFDHEWLCVGRVDRDPEPRRLLHHDRQRRASDRRPRQGRHHPRVLGHLPAPRHADRRRLRQLRHVHLPVPPVGLRARRPPARRTRHGTHRRLRQDGVGLPNAARRGVAWASCSSTSTPPPNRSRRRSAATSRSSSTTTCANALSPRQLHAHRSAVELEGDVRELQRRLPRQPIASHDPRLLPQQPRGVPRAVGRRART